MKKLLGSTRFWICCFLALALASAGVLIFRHVSAGGSAGVITSGGKEIRRFALKKGTEAYTLRIEAPGGGYNLVEVDGEKVRVTEASCPDQVCVRQGAISDSLTPIVCLPNQMIISVENAGQPPKADAAAE